MSQLYDSLKGLICPSMAPKAARIVGEKDANVTTAISSIIASMMGVILKNGNTQQLKNIFDEAGKLNILADTANICEEKPTPQQRKIGDDLLQNLLGDKAADFTAPIAKHAGISSVATNRLVSMMAPIVAGYFGKKLVTDGWSMQKLLNEIESQKNSFAGNVPNELARNFGLTSFVTSANSNNAKTTVPEKKKNNSWITWLIIVLVILLLIFLWRSCRNRSTSDMYNDRPMVTDTVRPTPVERARTAMDTASMRVNRDMEMREVTLANGTRLNVYRNGIEEQMIDYLKSDDYKNATNNDLKDKWFMFDNLAFEYGSGTELETSSRQQINNIIAILKNNPNVKVEIAGFADKKGTEPANMEVSKERAETMKRIFADGGVGKQVVLTEGMGDEKAKHSASESDSKRAEDRGAALRFVK